MSKHPIIVQTRARERESLSIWVLRTITFALNEHDLPFLGAEFSAS